MSVKKPLPGIVWLLAGLAIGLFVAFLIYLDKQPAEQVSFTDAVMSELEKARQDSPDTTKPVGDNNQEKKPVKEPRFDFYTILPELEVFIPESEISQPAPPDKPAPQSRPATETHKQYLLQAGSFRSREDADRLKASLALLGVQSSIQSVSINNESWHRVRIGPFSNTERLHDTLDVLKQHKIHAMTMELKK